MTVATPVVPRSIARTLAFVAALCGSALMPIGVSAQPANDIPIWALAGVNFTPTPRWLAAVRFGYVGGFDSRLLLADLNFSPGDAWQVVVGYVHVDPRGDEIPATSIMRGGAVWRPLRGRIAFENRVLAERLDTADRSPRARVRDRLMVSFATGGQLRLRPFANAEFFTTRDGFAAQRYQLGASRAFRRTTLEVYWTRHRAQQQSAFNTLGVTWFVRID